MRRLNAIIGIQTLAVVLAVLQWQVGVRTDEAKYLLNIPYPHPPAVRSILSLLKGWEYQEIFWRLVLATLLLQAAALVWDMARELSRPQRTIVSLSWIFSAAVLLQAGTVMMAPLTTLQALVFLWLQTRPELAEKYRGYVALFWLFSLFTAYQAVLFGPLVLALFWRMRGSLIERAAYVIVPVALLVLYTLSNPLAAASFGVHAGRQVTESLMDRAWGIAELWLLGGSVVLSITGTMGILRSRRWDWLLSLLLVFAYVALSRYPYYAILFTPLLAAGFSRFFDPHCKTAPWFQVPAWSGLLIAGCWLLIFTHSLPSPSLARSVMQSLDLTQSHLILISGSFGHEWQYESPAVVRRFVPSLINDAEAVICLDSCEFDAAGWTQVRMSPETWVRR